MKNISIKNATVTIHVSNLDQSISFYEVIGLDLHQRWDNHYAEMTTSGIKIGLHPVAGPDHVNGSGNLSIGFICDDLEKTKSILLNASIAIKERNEEGGIFLHFTDPDGTALYFIAPKW